MEHSAQRFNCMTTLATAIDQPTIKNDMAVAAERPKKSGERSQSTIEVSVL